MNPYVIHFKLNHTPLEMLAHCLGVQPEIVRNLIVELDVSNIRSTIDAFVLNHTTVQQCCDPKSKKFIRIGVTTDVVQRVYRQKLHFNTNCCEPIVQSVDHDLAALAECTGILILKKYGGTASIPFVTNNTSEGFDSPSFGKLWNKNGSVYAIMPYSKVMAKEDFMSSLYKNRMNLTIEVLDLCMHAFTSVRNQLK